MTLIDWCRIGRAVTYYRGQGFTEIDVPWVVSRAAVAVTVPPQCRIAESHLGCHVGSAEQSFIELHLRGYELDGFYQATTPCFRDEVRDELHQDYFMKTELYAPGHIDPLKVAEIAEMFFDQNLPSVVEIVQIATDTYDIMFDDVELGSYGRRTFELPNQKVVSFVYGTGLAEPRMSIALERLYR